METIDTRSIHDDPLPDRLLPAHAELRLIASSRAELEALVQALGVALGNSVSSEERMAGVRIGVCSGGGGGRRVAWV